jgi:hypothetical protein
MVRDSAVRECEFCGESYHWSDGSDDRLCPACYTIDRRIVTDQVYLAEMITKHLDNEEIEKHWKLMTSNWCPLQYKLVLFLCLSSLRMSAYDEYGKLCKTSRGEE